MDLNSIIMEGPSGQTESLVLAIQAIARSAGGELDYDDLSAALGVSFAAVSIQEDPAPGWWMTCGRDYFLQSAGDLFGLRIRNLHPPDVGVEMTQAEEYPQHWQASYVPLIERALENNQPMLAWRGWPGYSAAFWGVITDHSPDGLAGTVLWGQAPKVPLAGSALQCYVVEHAEPVQPLISNLLAMVFRHADAYMNRAPYTSALTLLPPSLITGPAAFDAWEKWLTETDFDSPGQEQAWQEHRQHAEFVSDARQSAARFLRHYGESVPAKWTTVFEEAIANCEALFRRLETSRDPTRCQERFADRKGREQLLADVHAAEADDRRLAIQIEQLAQAMTWDGSRPETEIT